MLEGPQCNFLLPKGCALPSWAGGGDGEGALELLLGNVAKWDGLGVGVIKGGCIILGQRGQLSANAIDQIAHKLITILSSHQHKVLGWKQVEVGVGS